MSAAALLRAARDEAEACEREFWRARLASLSTLDKAACGVLMQGDPEGPPGSFERRHLDAHVAAAWQASLASVAGEAWDAARLLFEGGRQTGPGGHDTGRAATVARLAGDETREGE